MMFYSVVFFLVMLLFVLRRKIDTFFIAAAGCGVYYFPVFTGSLYYMDSAAKLLEIGKDPDQKLQLSIVIIVSLLYLSSVSYSFFLRKEHL